MEPTAADAKPSTWDRLAGWFGTTTSDAIDIEAPAAVVWSVYSDVARWPEWTESVTTVDLDPEGPLSLGGRATIKQPRFPKVAWTVTRLEPERSWRWENRSPGSTATADHVLTPIGERSTHVDLSIDQRGLLGRPIGWLARRTTRRYLRLEAEGLRRRSESSAGHGAATFDDGPA